MGTLSAKDISSENSVTTKSLVVTGLLDAPSEGSNLNPRFLIASESGSVTALKLEDIKLPSLETLIGTTIAFDHIETTTNSPLSCDICKNFTGRSKASLGAHRKACIKKNNEKPSKTFDNKRKFTRNEGRSDNKDSAGKDSDKKPHKPDNKKPAPRKPTKLGFANDKKSIKPKSGESNKTENK
jgi:hypothetical protein